MRLGLGTWRRRARRGGQRGQSLVEFTFLVPTMLLVLVTMLEFGLAFDHQLTLAYASREGARTGSALANGGMTLPGCGSGQSPNAALVDPAVIAAVQRILESPGSPITLANVTRIRIYRADSSGDPIAGDINTWSGYSAGSGPPVDGRDLDFDELSVGWSACERSWLNPANSLGVAIDYRYDLVTPLGSLLRFMGGTYAASFTLDDRTVMSVNPVN
ncbi:MAG TPA: TadE family protein [Candidatus Limnocylindrales bacterium]